MQAQDIIWGGNNKCEIELNRGINMLTGALVDIEYNYITTKYELKYNGETTSIEVNDSNLKILNNIYLSGNNPATIVRVLDIEENICIIEIKIFEAEISFNALQAIKIEIDQEVIEKMRRQDQENPIEYLNKEFKYRDMLFVKGYGRKGANFTLVSKYRVLSVSLQNNIYTAKGLGRYNQSKADLESLYIIKGKIEFVNATQGARISKEVSEKMSQITSGGEYFDIWDAYNDLERLFVFKQATQSGILEYDCYDCELTDAFEYKFHLIDNNTEGFSEGAQIDCTDDPNIKKLDQFNNSEDVGKLQSISIGEFSKIEGNICTVIDKNRSSEVKFPNRGFLYYSVVGDTVRLRRRESAKDNIISKKSPLSNLAMIIDKGVGMDKQTKHEMPITTMLKRKMPNYNFNAQQKMAIEVAVNTPDIALILGPPGTGKTTVIKAIIARFEEYFKKYNDKEIPKILVTSFQHEAVENVIVGVNNNGIPPNRKGGRRDEGNKQTQNIRQWRNNISEQLSNNIEDLIGTIDPLNQGFRDRIYAWEEKGREITEGIKLLKQGADGNRLKLSTELNSEINEIIRRTDISNQRVKKAIHDWEEDEQKEIEEILNAQRLSKTSYADDGKRQIISLKQAIFLKTIECEGGTAFIDAVLETRGKDETIFSEYVEEVEKLRSKYIVEQSVSTAISSVTTIEQCLKRLADEMNKIHLEKIENADEAVAYILQKYAESIQDEKEIQNIVEKYSNITAATCQQSMESGRFAVQQTYDLVIVDEAARANPLDLLIPLSMGKQIILVGDFLQLPHMLDPDVTKQFEKDERIQALDILTKSLFEKLYRSFDRDNLKIKRTAQLSKQYRMNSVIGNFANEVFYKPNNFELDSTQIKNEEKSANLDMYDNKPIAWLNADKKYFGIESGKRSKIREKEANLILKEVKKVLKKNPYKTIGIISFYRGQVELLAKKVEKELTDTQFLQVSVGTVDAFQGKEFDVVFLSCVRANSEGLGNMRRRVGHIQDVSRLCVSFTRSKQLLVIVGDRDTVECVPILGKFIAKCSEKGVGYYEQIN